MKQLQAKVVEVNISTSDTITKITPRYVGVPNGALQLACERNFIDINGLLNGIEIKDPVTWVKTIDKETSGIQVLKL